MPRLAAVSGYYEASKKAMLVGLGYFAVTRPTATGTVLWRLIPPLAYSMARDTYLIVRVIGTERRGPEGGANRAGSGAQARAGGAAAAQPRRGGGRAQPRGGALAGPGARAGEQGARRRGAPEPAGVPEQYLTA